MTAIEIHTQLVQADVDQLEDVLCVLTSAAHWLREQGRHDWATDFDMDGWRAVKIREELAAGNVYLYMWGRHPLATVTITPWADPDFVAGWPDQTPDALYVMRLAKATLSRRLEVPPLGKALLDFAMDKVEAQAARTGRPHRLRLDCSRTNTDLHAYYERHGFRRVGEVSVPGRRSGALFEQSVTG